MVTSCCWLAAYVPPMCLSSRFGVPVPVAAQLRLHCGQGKYVGIQKGRALGRWMVQVQGLKLVAGARDEVRRSPGQCC